MIGIIILNWNGFEDTIECIKSLLQTDCMDFKIYLIDNFSTDGSQEKIQCFISANDLSTKISLILNNDNLGFAIGSNIGIKAALNDNCDYIWLLNNDTVVQRDTISKLITFMQNNPNVDIVTPKIVYYSQPDIIWNCGGIISRFGFRKYYYADKNTSTCPKTRFLITFVTNCASFFRANYFSKYGFLSERFFFGEEDFEMCLRNIDNKVNMYCIPESVLYHKVSSTIGKNLPYDKMLRKDFLYYLNRMVDMKLYLNNIFIFKCYFLIYKLYIKRLLKGKKYQKEHISSFLLKLKTMSLDNDNVDKAMFNYIMNDFDIEK
ncbi:MAG: glycosyltransferase family 2 protein [Bacteroidales bacterium]|nr:glycosyltransferase family 2 protein [Bacteroidales bacterium]